MKRATIFIFIMAGAVAVFCQGNISQGNTADQRLLLMQSHQKGLQRGAKINGQLQQVQATVPLQLKPVQAGTIVQKAVASTSLKKLAVARPISQRDWQASQRLATNKNYQPKPVTTLSNVKAPEQMAVLKEANHKPLQAGAKINSTVQGAKSLQQK